MGICEAWEHRDKPRRPSLLSFPPQPWQSRTYLGMSTLRDLIFKRPSRQFQYLHVLLDLSSHEKDKVQARGLVPQGTPPSPCQ